MLKSIELSFQLTILNYVKILVEVREPIDPASCNCNFRIINCIFNSADSALILKHSYSSRMGSDIWV